jgi:hypothetical protein
MAFGLIGLIGLVVALLVVVGIVVALARGLRSSRDRSDGGGGGIGIGIGVLLIAVVAIVLAGGGALMFGAVRSVVMSSSPMTAPSPGSVMVHVESVELEYAAIAQEIESALARAVSEECTTRYDHGQMHGTGLGANSGSATRTYVLEDAREETGGGFQQDALDFEALCREYEFALLGLVPEGTRPEDLSIVLGYCSMDDGTVQVAELDWDGDELRFVPADPDAIFPGGPSSGTAMQGMDEMRQMRQMQQMQGMQGALHNASGEPSTMDPSAAAAEPSVPASPDSQR